MIWYINVIQDTSASWYFYLISQLNVVIAVILVKIVVVMIQVMPLSHSNKILDLLRLHLDKHEARVEGLLPRKSLKTCVMVMGIQVQRECLRPWLWLSHFQMSSHLKSQRGAERKRVKKIAGIFLRYTHWAVLVKYQMLSFGQISFHSGIFRCHRKYIGSEQHCATFAHCFVSQTCENTLFIFSRFHRHCIIEALMIWICC